MSNPVLNERAIQNAQTWAPPTTSSSSSTHFPPVTKPPTSTSGGPLSDGPSSPWSSKAMTIGGVISATSVLFVLLLLAAAFGWSMQGEPEQVQLADGTIGYNYSIPMLAWGGVIVGFVLVLVLWRKPQLARFIAPVYVLAQGVFVGAISRMYETFYDGLVVQAAGATIAVFGVMLVLYRTRIIKVTKRFRMIVTAATIGIMVFYGLMFVIRLFAGADSISFLASPSLLGIAFSVFVAGLAAFNLALDFDFIERGVEQGLDKKFEWYAAFGLLVTIIWLYLEMLRLLAKLRER